MSNSKMLTALIGGAAAGAMLGVLLAPKAGSETRKQLMNSARNSFDSLDDLVEEGKKTWYETKGKAKEGVGIAADEVDDFIRHIVSKGKSFLKQAKNKGEEVADEASKQYNSAVSNGKKAVGYAKESLS